MFVRKWHITYIWSAVIRRYFLAILLRYWLILLYFHILCVHGLPVWGPSLSVNLLHCITHLHNRGVRMTSGLRKYNHVSHHRLVIGWLPVGSVIQHRSLVAMYNQYRSDHCLLLNPPIEFGHQSSYYTRTPASFANIFW